MLPGAEIVEPGLADLAAGRFTDEALAVVEAAPRLRRAGVEVPEHEPIPDAALLLHRRLDAVLGDAAHSRYNAIRRQVLSYAVAAALEARAC